MYLEIRYKISIKTLSSFNKVIFERYENIVKELSIKLIAEELLGSFLLEKTVPKS